MNRVKLKLIAYILVSAGLLFLQSCKKAEKQETFNPSKELTGVANQDFISITWETAKAQPLGTHEVHGEVVHDKLYIFGGYDINKRPQWTPTKRAYVYDPISNSWAAIKDLPHTPTGSNFGGATHFGLTNDGNDIYFAGGYISSPDGTGQVFGTKQVWKYNVASNTYTRLPDLPQALAAGQLRYVNGKIHYMGGANLSRADINIHLALDLNNIATGWKSLAPLINGVNHPGSAVLNGKIYFIGGAHYQDNNSIAQRTLEVYDELTNTWTNLAEMPIGIDHISSAVVTYGNRLIVLGGETSHSVLSSRVFAYTPATNSWTEFNQLPVAKSAGVAAVLNGNIYYVGGNFSNVNYKGVPVVNTTSFNILPLADTYVRNGSFASTNYGSDTSLIVKGSTASNYQRSTYLKFSLTDITSVTSATLRVYGRNMDNPTALNLSCYGIDNDTWLENNLVFNNAPQPTTSALSIASSNNQLKYIDFNVTNFVKAQLGGDKIVSLLIKDPANKSVVTRFNSKENQINKPLLVINK